MAVFVFALVMAVCGFSVEAEASSKYYSIFAVGTGYRDYFKSEPVSHETFISPYFEFGTFLDRQTLAGFEGMFVLNPRDTSEITLIQFGGQVREFFFARRLFLGGGPGITVEGKKVKHDSNSPNKGMTIENPKLFFNVNLQAGFTIFIDRSTMLIAETLLGQSFGTPFPYSVNLLCGLMSIY